MRPGTRYTLEVNPRIPKRLARLEELASNLWYSWDRPTRALFARLNPPLWDALAHSPKGMLKRIDEQRLLDAAADPAFLDSMSRVLGSFDTYLAQAPFSQNGGGVPPRGPGPARLSLTAPAGPRRAPRRAPRARRGPPRPRPAPRVRPPPQPACGLRAPRC